LLDVEGWAELRREHFVRGVSIKELARRTGMSRNTIRSALRAAAPPKYERALAGSKLDPFKDEIHRLLSADPSMPGSPAQPLSLRRNALGGLVDEDSRCRARPRSGDSYGHPGPQDRARHLYDACESRRLVVDGHGLRCTVSGLIRAQWKCLTPDIFADTFAMAVTVLAGTS
jgi:transcriptional regulator with XRE-family HTH domain